MADTWIEFNEIARVEAQGSVFNGNWEWMMALYKEDVADTLADYATENIKAYLPTQYMYLGANGGDPVSNPVPDNAGYLVSTIHYTRATAGLDFVRDGGYPEVIYGPWIEGIAPGNTYIWQGRIRRGLSPRFPGYHAFRRAAQMTQRRAVPFAEKILPHFIEMLNE